MARASLGRVPRAAVPACVRAVLVVCGPAGRVPWGHMDVNEGCLNSRSADSRPLFFFRSAYTPHTHAHRQSSNTHHPRKKSMGKPKGPKGPEVGIAFPIDKKGGR